VIFVGGAAFALGGSILLANLQLTTLSHPVGAVLALLALIFLGMAIGYVGFRLIIIKKDDEPLLKGRRNEKSKSSPSDVA
jgi:hypothetical protein